MNKSNLWSLRLGFSSNQSLEIEKNGIEKFIQKSIHLNVSNDIPDFLINEPKTIAELRTLRQSIKNADSDEQKKIPQTTDKKRNSTQNLVD